MLTYADVCRYRIEKSKNWVAQAFMNFDGLGVIKPHGIHERQATCMHLR